ncbi:MAG: hypothetical protein Q4G09_00330 [Clostridia bacterium]|nr:hypothetical protein [Clostridia bacterium]
MNVKRIVLLLIVALFSIQYQVNGYVEIDTIEYEKKRFKTIVEGNFSEENKIIEAFSKDIQIDGIMYTTESIEKTKSNSNFKEKTDQKQELLNTNNHEEIKKHFGEMLYYEDSNYKGELKITDIKFETITQGTYEEVDEKKIEFTGYSQNDLNQILKEKKINNTTYYLINVDWQVEDTETIDNQEIPKKYKGVMIYQTILNKKNPDKYNVIVTYSGEVERIDPIYNYSIYYTPITIDKPKETIPIIISGIGIGILTLLLFLKGNVKVYNKNTKGFKYLGKFKINEKNKVIDITKYQNKVNSNIYSLKINKKLYEKMKNKLIYIKIGKFKKQVYINNRYIEIII